MMPAPATGASWSAYWAQKADTPRADWEDGCAYSPSTGWFAVADGASSGVRSREWAFHLTRSFVEAARRDAFVDALDVDRFVAWTQTARASFDFDSAEFRSFDVPDWIHQAAMRKGAFATFLGGHLSLAGWRVVAVGDCCLFHVSGDTVTTFPLAPGHDPATAPMLVTSVAVDDIRLAAHTTAASGRLAAGDTLFVTSDALAAWLLAEVEHPATWTALRTIGSDGFNRLCRDLRSADLLKNDDVTMLRFVTGGAD